MKIKLNIWLGVAAGVLNCLIWYYVAVRLNYYSLDIDRYRYYATAILLILGIFICVGYERKQNGGYIEFKQALKGGLLYALTLGAILAIFNYIYYSVLVPDAISYFISEERKVMEAQKMPTEQIGKNLELIASYFGSFRMLMSTVIMGLIFSLLAAASLRKKNPEMPFSAN